MVSFSTSSTSSFRIKFWTTPRETAGEKMRATVPVVLARAKVKCTHYLYEVGKIESTAYGCVNT